MVKTLENFIEQEDAQVNIRLVVPDEQNVRGHYVKKEIIPLALSLARVGQEEPVLVEKKQGKYYLVSGHRRYWATMLGIQIGIISNSILRATVVSELPEDLRLKIQIDENDTKAKVPSDRLADSLWGRYQITLAGKVSDEIRKEIGRLERDGKTDRIEQMLQEETNAMQAVHKARDYLEIPSYLRQKLPGTDFAMMMGRSPSTVETAFAYQRVCHEVKDEVKAGRLSYSAGAEFAKIDEKPEQNRILKLMRDSDGWDAKRRKFKPRNVRWGIQEYIQGDEFMRPEKEKKVKRPAALREISLGLGEASRLVRTLAEMFQLDPDLQKTTAFDYQRKPLKTEQILENAYTTMMAVHKKFIQDDLYRKRWEFKAKRTRLEDMVVDLQKADGRGEVKLMDQAKFMRVNPDLVDENPLNPLGEIRDEEIEDLADSIKETGLIHPVILMRRKNGRYYNLGGHRRIKAVKRLDLKKVRARVLPELSEDQQLLLMYDEDIFENVDLHYRALGLARQYKLEKARKGEDYTVRDFSKEHRRWPRKIVEDAVHYDSLPESIKGLYRNDLITYRVAIDLSRVEGKARQIALAKYVAIFREPHTELLKILNEDKRQGFLFGDKEKERFAQEKADSERRQLLMNIQNVLEGVGERMKSLKPEDVSRITKAYDITHKFQRFCRVLEEVYSVGSNNHET